MRASIGMGFVAIAALSVLSGVTPAMAGDPPAVTNSFEGDDAVLGGVQVVTGTKLNTVKTWTVTRSSDSAELGAATIVFKNKSLVILGMPAGVNDDSESEFVLHGQHKGGEITHVVSVVRSAAPFVRTAGDTMTGPLEVGTAVGAAVDAYSGDVMTITAGVRGSNFGVGWGVIGDGGSLGAGGVFGTTKTGAGSGVYGDHNNVMGSGTGVKGVSNGFIGTGVMGSADSGVGVNGVTKNGVGVRAEVQVANNGLPLDVVSFGSSANLAVFRVSANAVARIDNAGVGYFDGGTQTGGADFAESVRVDRPAAEFEPGDVMVIDPKARRRFGKSSSADSALVVGVYSTKPGVLGRAGDVAGARVGAMEEVPLAIVGIVPCKVCDEGGPVRIGDLLSTSSVPGYAKRAPVDPKAGTLLGKALDSLEKGRASIEVFLIQR
jgi:hypothetical protein